MTNKVCPRCNKSVGTIKIVEQDRKTGKKWLVEKCFKCHFNFDLEETTRALDVKERVRKWNSHFGLDGD